MKREKHKYSVAITWTSTVTKEVYASSEEEALEVARGLVDNDELAEACQEVDSNIDMLR